MAPARASEPTAMIYTLSSPGPRVALPQFLDWYYDYHAPSRTSVPGIKVRRLVSLDDQKPEWLAVYELTSPDILASDAYLKLWETAPQYERELMGNCETMERRVYNLVSRKTSKGYDIDNVEQKKGWIFHAVGLVPAENSDLGAREFKCWYEGEHIPLLMKVPGWLRSTRWELQVQKCTNREIFTKDIERTKVSKYLAVHVWESDVVYETEEFKTATGTEWREKIMKRADSEKSEKRQYKC